MHQQMIDAYTALMGDLRSLPGQIAGAQTELTDDKIEQAARKKAVDEVEFDMIERAGGMKALGANDVERKAGLERLRRGSRDYQYRAKNLQMAEIDVLRQQDRVDSLTRHFTAVSYAARLHAGLLAYLAAAMPPVDRNGDVTFATNGNGAGAVRRTEQAMTQVSASDAAEIGL